MTYEGRLNALRLTTIEVRMIRTDLIHVFKILNNIDRVDKDKFFLLLHQMTGGDIHLSQIRVDLT